MFAKIYGNSRQNCYFFSLSFGNSVQFRGICMYIPNLAFQRSGEGHLPFQGSEMHIPHHISESLETIFWVKNTLILWWGSGIWKLFVPGSGIRDGRTRLRAKHPGSATHWEGGLFSPHINMFFKESRQSTSCQGWQALPTQGKPLFQLNGCKKSPYRRHYFPYSLCSYNHL